MKLKVSEVDKWLDVAIAQEKLKRHSGVSFETSPHIEKTFCLFIEVTEDGLGRLRDDIEK